MPRWLWWMPLGVLILGFGLFGLRWGWQVATITESDVIGRYAAQYLQDHGAGAALTDCVATAGAPSSGIWLVVRCTPRHGEGGPYAYFANRFGQQVAPPEPPQRVAEPQT